MTDNDNMDCSTDDNNDFNMTKGDFASAMDAAMALPEVVMGDEKERQKVSAYRYVLVNNKLIVYSYQTK